MIFVIEKVLPFLNIERKSELQKEALLNLNNICCKTSDTSEALLENLKIHNALLTILENTREPRVIYEAIMLV